jgi:homogentisate 1,2-dioxygenase
MKKWIQFPLSQGEASRQAHAILPAGTFEREVGREGFFGPATHFHHIHAPTGWTDIQGDVRPRAFDLNKIETATCPWSAVAILGSAATTIRMWRPSTAMEHLVRNADGDDLLFVHEGGGEFYCDYGHLTIAAGDYLLIPRGTVWRLEPRAPSMVLMIEATNDAFKLPDRGMLGDHAQFDPAILDTPVLDDAFREQQDDREWEIHIKRGGKVSRQIFPYNPLDATGWHGNLAPVRLNWKDIRPIMSARYHLPPSAHTTFLASRFVVCTFVPRPIESDPDALKLPFYHNNDDYDEFVFYHRGQFFSRDNIHPGMTTFHPSGFTHGPHPKAYEIAQKHARKDTDEVAVMIDSRDYMSAYDLRDGVEWNDYVHSWKSGG